MPLFAAMSYRRRSALGNSAAGAAMIVAAVATGSLLPRRYERKVGGGEEHQGSVTLVDCVDEAVKQLVAVVQPYGLTRKVHKNHTTRIQELRAELGEPCDDANEPNE